MGNEMEGTVASRKNVTFKRGLWIKLSYFFTLFLPNSIFHSMGIKGEDEVQFHREKVSFLILTMLSSILFLIIGEGLPNVICNTNNLYSISTVEKEGYNIIHGKVVNLKNNNINKLASFSNDNKGKDISLSFPKFSLFARLPGRDLSPYKLINDCVNDNDFDSMDNWLKVLMNDHYEVSNFKLVNCPVKKGDNEYSKDGPCFYENNEYSEYQKNIMGDVYLNNNELNNNYFILNNKVYDTSLLILNNNITNNNYFINKQLNELIINDRNKDITSKFNNLKNSKAIELCLDNLIYKGKLMPNTLAGIYSNCMIWYLPIIMILLPFLITIIRLFLNLISILMNYQQHNLLDINNDTKCILFLNCFNETKSELLSSINSLINSHYTDHNKLLMIISDGNSCTDSLLDILNYNGVEPKSKTYQSLGLGKKNINFAKVYSGHYYNENHGVPYILIVKVGNNYEMELNGNRGKRDSLLILLNFLDGLTSNENLLTPLEEDIQLHMDQLEIDPLKFDYLLNMDGDILLDNKALIHMTSFMQRNSDYIAVSGQILLKDISNHFLLYPLQLFHNYLNRNIQNYFNFKFNLITQLRSGLILYRLKQATGSLCLMDYDLLSYIINKRITTLHTRHMVLLGEEQYIHTCLLKHWKGMKLGYIQEAKATTLSYQSFQQLLKREKNLFNTKLHNTFELFNSSCIFSSKIATFIVILIKFLAQLLSPIFLLYFYAMLLRGLIQLDLPSVLIPIVTLFIIVLLFLSCVIEKNNNLLLGCLYYITIGLPFYYIIIPIYSLIKMDDLNWYDLGGDQVRSRPHGAIDGENFDNTHKSRYTFTPYEKSYLKKSPSIPKQLPMSSLYTDINRAGVPISTPSDNTSLKSRNSNMIKNSPLNTISNINNVNSNNNSNNNSPTTSNSSSGHNSSNVNDMNNSASRTSLPVSPVSPTFNHQPMSPMEQNLEKSRGMSWQVQNNSEANAMKLGGIAKNFPLPPSTTTDSKSSLDQPIMLTLDRSSIGSKLSNSRHSGSPFATQISTNKEVGSSRLSGISLQGSLNRTSQVARLPPFAPRDPKMMSVVGSDYSSEYSISINYNNQLASDAYTQSSAPSQQNTNPMISNSMKSSSYPEQVEAIEQSQQMISEEIYYFLQDADLHTITRREVKEHLYTVFGENIEYYKEFIEQCIEEITLERLAMLEDLNLTQISTGNNRDSQAL